MKKRINIFIITVFAAVLVLFSGCNLFKNNELVIQTDIDGYTVKVGDVVNLKTNASEIDAGEETWKSSNTEVARVDENGTMIAIASGTVYIYVTAGEQIATVKFTVYNSETVNTSYISSGLSDISVFVGDVILLKCNDVITKETHFDAVWTSESDIISLTTEGLLTALKAGVAEALCAYDGLTYSVRVTVISKGSEFSIEIEGPQTVQIDSTINLTYTISDASYKLGVKWSTNDASVAIVDNNGCVRGVSGGLCTITATSLDDASVYDEYLVYVVPNYSSSSQIVNEIYKITGDVDFTSLSNKVVKIIEDNYYAVVGVANYQEYGGTLITFSVGTGMIYKKMESEGNYKYYVLTNYHVVEDAQELKIYYQPKEEYIPATLLATDADLDLAVLEFEMDSNVNPVEFEESANYKTGEFVLAIGHPTGFDYYNSATFGIISYVDRVMKNETALFIQHDAAINSGNSGGPLFDMNGKVIGVNTLKIAASDVDNMGFAISLNDVMGFLTTNNLLP